MHDPTVSSDDQTSTVLLAFYLRYPNPHATHVLSCDVISRKVDPLRGVITTQRLILKKGIVPRWARTWLENWGMMGGGGLEAWVLEESEVGHLHTRRRHWILILCGRSTGNDRFKHQQTGSDFHDEEHLPQENHSRRRRNRIPSSSVRKVNGYLSPDVSTIFGTEEFRSCDIQLNS
jgi:hypothetical protein